MQRRNLLAQVLRHGRAVGLVGRIDVVAEGLARGVEDHRHVCWAVLILELAQHVQDTHQGPGRLALGVGQLGQGVVGAKEVRRAIDQDQGIGGSSGEQKHPAVNYSLVETWRQLRFLVEKFSLTRQHPQVEKAAEFVFSCQSPQGDLRGILANQYATYYTGAILSLLIQAGYVDDARIEKGFDWLLAMRQEDGGWTIPLLTHKLDRATIYRLTSEYAEPLEPDRSKPSPTTGPAWCCERLLPIHATGIPKPPGQPESC